MRNLHSRKLKVRTGCVTCKIRKVKCDEAKPACRRCVNTGRKCDGYRGQSRPEDEGTPCVVPVAPDALVPGGSASPFADVAGLSLAISAEDRHLLQYFSTKAGPMFSGLADRKFWSFVLPQLSMSEPAVRHALLAVSTFQAAWEHGSISNQVTNELGYRGSVKHYNLAIASLQQNLTEESTKLEVPLICCLLFICLECLYDERELVLEHLHNGLNILTSPRFKDSWNAFAMSIKPNLQQIFRRLDAQATLFGRPASCRFGDPTEDTGVMISTTFASLYEAQQGLDILMGLALNFIRLVHDASWAAQRHAPSTFITLGRLKAQFETWERGLGQFTATSTHDDASHLEWISRLRIQFFAGYIYLCNSLDKFESSYDAFEAEFRSIVSLARTLVELPGHTRSMDKTLPVDDTLGPNTTSFALDAELIPSLYLTAIKCRNPDIRRDAILMLEKVRFREGLWNAELHARVARRAVEIEEAGMLISQGVTEAAMEAEPSLKMQASGLSLCGPPDEIFRLQGIHIHTLSGRSSRSVPVIFCLAPDGVMEPWKKWEEQIPL